MQDRKIKRKLSNIDFDRDGAHIALCHRGQGAANMQEFALVLKSKNFSDEFIEKIQQVKVTMELPDFLEKFFYIYNDDAEILAYMMGYVEPTETPEDEMMEAEEDFQDWIESRMEAFEIIKSAAESENMPEILSNLTEDQYFALLKDQEQIEKALKAYDKKKKDAAEKAKTDKKKPRLKTTRSFEASGSMVSKSESPNVEQSTKADVNTSTVQNEVKEGKGNSPVVKTKQKEKLMTQEVKVVEQVVEMEMIEKSAFEAIQKQAQEQAEILKAAIAELEIFKAEKAALIAKSRKQSIVDAVKSEDKAELLFKAVSELSDDKFEAVVDIVKQLTVQVEKSDLFVEKGATVDTQQEQVKESAVAAYIKKQQATK